MDAKGTVMKGGGEHSDVRELRPNQGDESATDAGSPLSRGGEDGPPESVAGDLLEPDEDEVTPSLGSPRDAASSLSHKPPPRPHPHPPEKGSSLAPPRPSAAPPSSDSEIRITPPVINMGFDGLQMLLETRLREVNTELGKVAQASSRGQLIRGALLLLAFAGAGVVIGYLAGSSVEGRTRANIREEVMKTYYAPEVALSKRKEILGFVQGQLAKSDLGLRLWVDGELRKVDRELQGAQAETVELAALRSQVEQKDVELRETRDLLERAEAKIKTRRASRGAVAAATKATVSEPGAEAVAEPAPPEAASAAPEEE